MNFLRQEIVKFQQESRRDLQTFWRFLLNICEHITKIRDEHLLNFLCRRGAKEAGYFLPKDACKLDRSGQELSLFQQVLTRTNRIRYS